MTAEISLVDTLKANLRQGGIFIAFIAIVVLIVAIGVEGFEGELDAVCGEQRVVVGEEGVLEGVLGRDHGRGELVTGRGSIQVRLEGGNESVERGPRIVRHVGHTTGYPPRSAQANGVARPRRPDQASDSTPSS